ncbi:MAG TPA: hypothetical protein ENH62_14715 [Marinobacter sp.]|uniref:Uncharacterized protein n=1 Tax=marine sediment metagenome TaxID=412755 RepID=A0A0F9KTA7_9ZZZZ|nr:hypothetical protein [Marinobacter sp.]
MSDILKRLRRWAHPWGCGCTRCTAANEIERLTAAGEDLLKRGVDKDNKIHSLTAEVSVLQAIYSAAKYHIDVRLPAEPGFDEAVFAADKFYESTPSGTQEPAVRLGPNSTGITDEKEQCQ